MTILTLAQQARYERQHAAVFEECAERVAKAFGPQVAPTVNHVATGVCWNNRLSSAMGRCKFAGVSSHQGRPVPCYQIDYSTKLYALATPEKVRDNMIHEIAHAFAHAISGKMGHDAAWRAVMVACGAEPNRTFEANEANFGENAAVVKAAAKARRRKGYIAPCGCRMGPIQYKKTQRGVGYRCRHGKLDRNTQFTKES